MIQLQIILPTLEQNPQFANHPDCQDTLQATFDFYQRVGFAPPWVSYYVARDGVLVGCCAFKGAPKNGRVEIAYGIFPQFQQQGIAGAICRALTELALQTDPDVLVTARTLPETNFSNRALAKNGFVFGGTVDDEEDGLVWEWEYRPGA